MNEPSPEENKVIESIGQENTQEKDPYSGIFFEVDVLLEKAKAACIERLQPLTIREPKEGEAFACVEVFNYEDFGLNYNTFSKINDEVDINFEMFGDTTAIPGLQEHIEEHLEGKSTSQEQNEAFEEKLRERLFDFFSDSWKKAGGLEAKLPTYFCFEKEVYDLMDFQTGEVFSQQELFSKLSK